MTLVLKGVMQSPVTPLKNDFSPDYETFERLVDFHVRTGATAISWPHHKAESHNLTIAERKALGEVAIKAVNKRVPVSIHVSALALEDTFDLARHAQKKGADAIIAITPYFWKYPPEAIYDYFVKLGTSFDLPLIAYNSPSYLDGIDIARGAAAAVDFRDDCRRRVSSAFGVAWRCRLLFVGGRDMPQFVHRTLRVLHRRRFGSRTGGTIQAFRAVAPVPRSISIVAERRLRDHGSSGWSDAAAPADRLARTGEIH